MNKKRLIVRHPVYGTEIRHFNVTGAAQPDIDHLHKQMVKEHPDMIVEVETTPIQGANPVTGKYSAHDFAEWWVEVWVIIGVADESEADLMRGRALELFKSETHYTIEKAAELLKQPTV